jgi:hypothetical protein
LRINEVIMTIGKQAQRTGSQISFGEHGTALDTQACHIAQTLIQVEVIVYFSFQDIIFVHFPLKDVVRLSFGQLIRILPIGNIELIFRFEITSPATVVVVVHSASSGFCTGPCCDPTADSSCNSYKPEFGSGVKKYLNTCGEKHLRSEERGWLAFLKTGSVVLSAEHGRGIIPLLKDV